MTLAEAIIRKDPAVLSKNVFRLMGIVQDTYRQPVARAIEEIIHLAHIAVEDNIANGNVIYGYAGYRETIPACFVDMVCKQVKLDPIPSWDTICPIWLPCDERLEYEKIPMEELQNIVPGAQKFNVGTVPLEDISVILRAEIYSAIPFLMDRIPETTLALYLTSKGHISFGWTRLCHINAGAWDLKKLSEEEDVLHFLCTDLSLIEDQLDLRDDLFNHISLYHTIKQKEEDACHGKHQESE